MDNQRCRELYGQGKTYREISDILGENYETVRSCIMRTPNYQKLRESGTAPETPAEPPTDIEAAIRTALKKPNGLDKEQFCTQHRMDARILAAHIDVLRDSGLLIEAMDGRYRLQRIAVPPENEIVVPWNGDRIIRFGAMGDTQFGSKDQQLTALQRMYDIYKAEGIDTVFHTGDMTDGEKMRPGHSYELFLHGADEQSDYTIENYPRRDGIRTKFILGNHDESHIKNGGHDIGRVIGWHFDDKGIWVPGRRDDMDYLGMSNARVLITPNCTVELLHPGGGSAYAISYAPQKILDSLPGGEKPSIMLIGHYHKREVLFYRNVHCVQTACFQWQTRWEKNQKIQVAVGGYIIEVHVTDDGTISRFKEEFFPVYSKVEHDY